MILPTFHALNMDEPLSIDLEVISKRIIKDPRTYIQGMSYEDTTYLNTSSTYLAGLTGECLLDKFPEFGVVVQSGGCGADNIYDLLIKQVVKGGTLRKPGWGFSGNPREIELGEKPILRAFIDFGPISTCVLADRVSVPSSPVDSFGAMMRRAREGLTAVPQRMLAPVPPGVWMIGQKGAPFLSLPIAEDGLVVKLLLRKRNE